MIYSRFGLELRGESYTYIETLMNSFMGAVCAGASFFLAERIIPTNRRAVLANLENAAVEQPNIQQR